MKNILNASMLSIVALESLEIRDSLRISNINQNLSKKEYTNSIRELRRNFIKPDFPMWECFKISIQKEKRKYLLIQKIK